MRKTLQKFKNDYLSLSANIRNGVLIILLLIGVSLLIPFIYSTFIHKTPKPFTEEEISLYDSLLARSSTDTLKNKPIEKKIAIISKFDPNKISSQEWVEMGVNEYIANRIAHYIEKGGHFKTSSDVLKIYGFDTTLFNSIEHYMVFPSEDTKVVKTTFKTNFESNPKSIFIKKKRQKLELNGADSLQLTLLYGIGPSFASRILKYRNLLGGFYSINQLKEVYGLNDSIFQLVSNQIIVDSVKVVKLDFKTLQFSQLQKHPYIGKYKAKLIDKLRKAGYTANKKELIENNVFTQSEYFKIQPYLE